MQEQESSRDSEIVKHVLGAPDMAPAPPLEGVPDGDGDQLPPDPLFDGVDEELLAALALEPANDTGNGKRLLGHFGDELLHVREIGWHGWQGTHWEAEGGEEIATRCAQTAAARIALEAKYITATVHERDAIEGAAKALRELNLLNEKPQKEWTEADKDLETALQRRITRGTIAQEAIEKRQITRRKYAVSSGNTTKIKGMLAQALPHRTVTPDDLDSDPLAFNCRNGTLRFSRELDLECPDENARRYISKVELLPHDRADLMTKCAAVEYDPKATAPKFMKFFAEAQPSEAVRAFLQTYYGYSITGLTGEQFLIFNYGGGANGKSVFIEMIARVIDQYAQTLSFETIASEGAGRRGDQATPDLARLPGARLVRISEPKRGAVFDEALIKSLTGGEPMLVRHLHKGFFEYLPTFKMTLSGNHKPKITGGDLGIWRRMRLVPWLVTIPEDKRRAFSEVIAEFWEERSGILNWLIEGALRYLAHGITVPEEIRDATDGYREENDYIANFMHDVLIDAPDEKVSGAEMYEAWEAWCKAQPIRPWASNTFGTALQAKGIKKSRPSGRSVYHGIKLNPDRPMFTRSHGGHDAPVPEDDSVPL
ncbi:MAG TPA: phage/plasmid primase, P4 family [Xanthobacteraceae bacterium]|nr:phage/plasmid primase, P4 family [Xanthobacteraceae bacterium]